MFAQDFMLASVSISGEISNCKYHQSGHIYFTLKDDKSQIACIMFASDARKLTFRLEEGLSVTMEGRVDIYERSGQYQFYARSAAKNGEGVLYEKFLALKEELMERGMFAEEYKRPIPKYIHRLGVVTAPTGAAVRDIIQITQRRNPWVQIILYPALVQGDGAAASIVNGIHALERQNVDTIIVGRGGGSIEDLWAFNEEAVAEAIFESEIPIISAVGHETDFTIADFVADKRASTPSAAAEIAVFEASRITDMMEGFADDLNMSMDRVLRGYAAKLDHYRTTLEYLSPRSRLIQQKTYTVGLEEKLNDSMSKVLSDNRHRLQVLIMNMKGRSPLEKLNQGYMVGVSAEGRRIGSVNDVNGGDRIKLYVRDGYINASVEDTCGE